LVSQNQAYTAHIRLAALVTQKTMDGTVVELVMFEMVVPALLETQLLAIHLMADAKHLVEHVFLVGRNNIKVALEKLSKG